MEYTKELRELAYYAETGRCAERVVELLLGNSCNDYPINCCDACREDADAAINALANRIEREHEEAMAALEGRLMPEGAEWPRFADGEPMQWGDEFVAPEYGIDEPQRLKRLVFIAPELLEEWGQDDGEKFAYEFNFFRAENKDYRPKRPKPAVLAADGLPIEVGQKVYDEHCSAHIVSEIDATKQTVEFEGEPKGGWVAACLTHACSDTQERIDEDVVAFANECARYAGQASSNDWFEVEIGKLLRRQRELCEREAERG